MLNPSPVTRREMIRGSLALTALALGQYPLSLFGGPEAEEGGVQIPFQDPQPAARKQIQWERLESWVTPLEDLYVVSHYNTPALQAHDHTLEISGLVRKPMTLSLADLKARRKKTVLATLECGGNGASPGFMGAVGNVRWTGTPLAPLLQDCQPLKRGIEAVFFGLDEKVETIRQKEYLQNFARSLHITDALRDEVLLCYEMNGQPLTSEHGFPLRLVVPGWYGISWVKWLNRIEIIDRRYMSKYMAREYVTIRGEERDGKTIWRETSVGPINVKSILARAVRLPDGIIRLTGAAWTDGTPLKAVEVRIDDGSWVRAEIDRKQRSKYSWSFWSYDWADPAPGEHTLVSRATDEEGRIQPAADDPAIQLKRTYWEANQQVVRKIVV